MADFGDFEAEVDPAADFLAREQSDLAGLEDELKPAVTATPVSNLINGDGNHSMKDNSTSSFEMIDALEPDGELKKEPAPLSDGLSSAFSHDFDRREGVSPTFSTEAGDSGEMGGGDMSAGYEEQENIKKWREEQVKRLEIKDREEEVKRQEWREAAKRELEDWYRNHEEVIAKTKAANRNAEKQFVADDGEIAPGSEWERIARLCDFNPKAKTGSRDRDVTRMRSIILQRKQAQAQSQAV